MSITKQELVNQLIDFYGDGDISEVKQYLNANFDNYFDEDFFCELENKVSWMIHDAIQRAEDDLDFQKEHVTDVVRLDKDSSKMYFNDNGVPAYWYNKKMSESEIKDQLNEFRQMWFSDGLPDYTYPMLEHWHSLKEWQKEFREEELARMERDLECQDNESAKILASLYECRIDVWQVRYEYPNKIKRILKVENKYTDKEGTSYADVTLKLYNNSQCKVRVYATKGGGFRGMTSLGRNGFPMMTDADNKRIEREVFGKE